MANSCILTKLEQKGKAKFADTGVPFFPDILGTVPRSRRYPRLGQSSFARTHLSRDTQPSERRNDIPRRSHILYSPFRIIPGRVVVGAFYRRALGC